MAAIIKNTFKINSAKAFCQTFSDDDKNYYVFVGKSLPWSDDLNPPLPQDTRKADSLVWDEMVGLKKVSPGDVSLVIPRWDWKSGTLYFPYDDSDASLYSHPTNNDVTKFGSTPLGSFYVMNSAKDLFICLDNNNNSVSTVSPTKSQPVTDLVTCDDGYVWKYIATVDTTTGSNKFLTQKWIPIQTLTTQDDSDQWTVQDAAIPGQLLRIEVTEVSDSPSSEFTHAHTGTIKIQSEQVAKIISTPDSPWPQGEYEGYQLRVKKNQFEEVVFDVSDNYRIEDGSYIIQIDASDNFVASGFEESSDYVYALLPKVVVETNGDADSAIDVKPVVDSETKKLTSVDVVTRGRGATSLRVRAVAPTNQNNFVVPQLRGVLDSLRGLGKDPETDLGASFVMVASTIQYDAGEGDFSKSNDYRQIGILKNVKRTNNQLATEDTLRPTKKLTVTFEAGKLGVDGRGFAPDSSVVITNTASESALGRLIVLDFSWDEDVANKGYVTYVQTPDTEYYVPSAGDVLTSEVVGDDAKASINANGVESEELKRFVGDIIYLENRRPINRAPEQTEEIKIVVEF